MEDESPAEVMGSEIDLETLAVCLLDSYGDDIPWEATAIVIIMCGDTATLNHTYIHIIQYTYTLCMYYV